MSSISARLTAIKSKTADLVVKEVKLPESSADPLTLFESNSAAKADSSNEWIIDVLPSNIPSFMFILSLAVQFSTLIDHKEHAKSSLPTVALYLMAVYHGYFLLNDLHVRPSPSAHARTWSQISWKNEFANFLLSLPVPQKMETIFAQLAATQTERTKNVFFIPSAAGYQHDVYYGRIIPLNLLAHIHDCIATMPGNSTRLAIMNDLFPRQLYRLRPTGNNPVNFDSIIADLLGITATGNNTNAGLHTASKFYQMFSSVFNPVLFRDFHRRSSLSTLDLQIPTFKTQFPNAYDVMFSATAMNLKELKVVLQSLSTILQDHVPMKKNLCQIISESSGTNILSHGYSTFALPTWSSNLNLPANSDFPALVSFKSESPSSRAAAISFLQPADTRPTPTTDLTDVTLTGGTNPSVSNRHWPWSLLAQTDSATPLPLDSDLITMTDDNEHDHTYPRVLVLDTLGDKTISAHLATLTGKIIESFEIDASTVEMPRADKSLGLQNSMFADSAIPFKYVLRATRFYPRQKGTILAPLVRSAPVSTSRLPAATILHDRTHWILPRINKTIIDTGSSATLHDFWQSTDWNWLRYAQRFIGYRTVSNNNHADQDKSAGMELGRLHLFSPYTYTPYEDDDNDSLVPNMAESRHYFITNLRTIFGTDFNLIEVKHPFEAMPVM
nr:capsid protein [Sarcosphaera coronaria partitivirus]